MDRMLLHCYGGDSSSHGAIHGEGKRGGGSLASRKGPLLRGRTGKLGTIGIGVSDNKVTINGES